jgi:hypothetical protein
VSPFSAMAGALNRLIGAPLLTLDDPHRIRGDHLKLRNICNIIKSLIMDFHANSAVKLPRNVHIFPLSIEMAFILEGIIQMCRVRDQATGVYDANTKIIHLRSKVL